MDEFQNTNVKGVYAVGDVCGKALLTPGNASSFSGGEACVLSKPAQLFTVTVLTAALKELTSLSLK